ncbi:MAG: circadian clock KaiB family protein [Acidobacteria bacterium]|nr:circadian clock KaiB family protein [Acidobacteriota bacterium]
MHAQSLSAQALYILHLYVNPAAATSQLAVKNLKRVCEEHLKGRYDLKVINIHTNAGLARTHQIVAVPTLIKRCPAPVNRLVGDMSNVDGVLRGLDVQL